MTGEQQVKFTAGSFSVEIWGLKLDHTLAKPLVQIPLPRQKTAMDAQTDSDSFLIDIGRVKQNISVAGYLTDDVTSSAITKKNDLIKIVKFERTVTMVWGTTNAQTYTGNISKMNCTETPGKISDGTSSTDQERSFDVLISFMVGSDK